VGLGDTGALMLLVLAVLSSPTLTSILER